MATYADKLERIKKNIQGRTGLSNLVPGSKAFQFIEATSFEAMQLEYKMEEYVRRVSILTATGKDLDNIGNKVVGVKRLGQVVPFVTASMKAIKLYVKSGVFGDINKDVNENPIDIVVPEGVIISGILSGQSIRLRISKQVTLSKDASEAYIDAEYLQGPVSAIPTGIINSHNFKNYTQAINNRLLVVNSVPIGSGREEEADDNYRYRIVNNPRAIPKTTYQGIYQAAITTSGVSNAFLEQASNGGGTFTIYVQGTTPITADEVVEDVNLKVSDIVGPWVVFNVRKPNYIGLSASLSIDTFGTLTNPEAVRDKIKALISDQINNFYGTEFFIESILRTAISAHANISNATFDYVHVYSGAGELRGYQEIDLNENQNPVLYLSSKEKLIVEPIANSITSTIG